MPVDKTITNKMHKTHVENNIKLFCDMIETYKSNYPYLISNSKQFIESSLKSLDMSLLRRKDYYDIDHVIDHLNNHNKINTSLITKITEIGHFIKRIESGLLPIDYENTIKTLIETAVVMVELLYHNSDVVRSDDSASVLYHKQNKGDMKDRFDEIHEFIKSNIKKIGDDELFNIMGPVYYYSSGEKSVGKVGNAVFVDIENAIVEGEAEDSLFERKDGKEEDILKIRVITQSSNRLEILIWGRWKRFSPMLKNGERISIIGGAVQEYPSFDEVHLLDRSYLVVRPDILMNATTISNIIEKKNFCLNKYLLNLKKRSVADSKPAMRGIMTGEIVDDYIIENENFDFKQSFEKHYREKLHKMPFIRDGFNPQMIYRQIATQMYVIDTLVWNKDKPVYDRPQFIEPFYISPKYGLEGRMDIMYIDKKREILRIYELKSGKAPSSNYPPWDNHSYQTHCYKLIADSVYNYKDSMSFVLYSSSENPLRRLNYDFTAEIMEARNMLIWFIDRLIDTNTDSKSFLNIQKDAMCFNCPPYMGKECINDYELFSEKLHDDELDYYVTFFKLIEREKHQSRILSSYLWKKTLSEREQLFTAVSDLSVSNIKDSLITFRMNNENNSDLRSGDQVYIHRGNPTGEELFRGSIIELKKELIHINLYKKLPADIEMDGWCVDRAYSVSGIDAQHTGLYGFIKAKQHIRDLILGRVRPQFRKRKRRNLNIDKNLNNKQQEAFHLCMNAKDYALIQGPPGTGKTFTIAGIVKQLVEDGKKVLITAYTNRAVDNILKMLKNTFGYDDYIRVGSIYNIDKEILPRTIDNIVKEYDIDESEKLRDDMLTNQVFASTTTSAVTTLVFDHVKFDYIIVDEAGQMTEPSTLTVINFADKFLLFGDDKQLPPIVTDDTIKEPFAKNEHLSSVGLKDLRTSLFERLWRLNKSWEKENSEFQSTVTLNIQYRMNKSIADISNTFFYNGIIKSASSNTTSKLSDIGFKTPINAGSYSKIINPNEPVCFISCRNEKVSKENEIEANIIYHIVYNLLSGGVKPELIGIIAPYKAQCALIRKKIDKILPAVGDTTKVLVDTVERYQGGEKEVVITSFTVGDENMLMFLSEYNTDPTLNRKLNVSITRAKKKLVMVGNSSILKGDPVYNQLILYLKSRGVFYEWKDGTV